MGNTQASPMIEAMVCSNKDCDIWYRVGNHFFTKCPNCNEPMIKTEKELKG